MYMAKVVGSIVSTQKDDALVGKKLMIVQPINSDQKNVRHEEVAIDTVGAGIGEYVLIARGAGARIADIGNQPEKKSVSDCSIIGIIDRFDN
ncbi:EutN/CcmL family microcompartment protein [Limosilactobacillus panis]|uniref:EutN/CcmL family microcompartment protein n=1 Tax=Limosilactobacillus panis TaxID=47493 RepID=UPI0021BC1319|nr:EutN/CcmL family microcompartment protein [Limosilactobacillus panis]